MKIMKISGGMFVKLDDDDFEILSTRKWKAHKSSTNYYARRNRGDKTSLLMHRVIMNAPSHLQVHHINGDTLDNQKCNLRLCTNQENHASHKRKWSGISKYRGVSKCGKRWASRMMVSYKNRHIGVFDTEEEAALARDKFAYSLYGDIAQLNFPDKISYIQKSPINLHVL